ncbi:glycosyltransferase [Verrucomicrobiota bacterium]
MDGQLPRTLLLTSWAPDTRYKVIQRIVARLPPDRLWWASLARCDSDAALPFEHRSFAPRRLHWRLQNTTADFMYAHELQGVGLARRIAGWARPFKPQVIWVLSEWGAAKAGYLVHRILDVPLHVTVHDAYETARFLVPRSYYPVYLRSLRRISRHAASTDAVSLELLDRLRTTCARLDPDCTMEFHPSISRDVIPGSRPGGLGGPGGRTRKIGFCGASRVSPWQWEEFLGMLARLPFDFEILAFANRDLFPASNPPANVTVVHKPFAETEAEVIAAFHETGVQACYLGLWKEPARRLFGRTSLSAKLTTYAAAGLPVIVNGPADSVAWRLAGSYAAGVLCETQDEKTLTALRRLFEDEEVWNAMSDGSRRMCREEFDLDTNVSRFARMLERSAAPGTDRAGRGETT